MTRLDVVPSALALSLALALATPVTAQDVAFKKDVKQYLINGDDRDDVSVSIILTGEAIVITRKADATTIPYAAISSITYDRRSRVRRMAPTYGKRLQHFLTIQYQQGEVGHFVELEMGKNVAPNLVATLEARSGQKIERLTGS